MLCLGASTIPVSAQATTNEVTLKVIETKIDYPCTMAGNDAFCDSVLAIKAIVDGRTFWMTAGKPKDGLLNLGSYKAHLVKDEHGKGYKYQREYELLYPDGEREKFTVIGESQ